MLSIRMSYGGVEEGSKSTRLYDRLAHRSLGIFIAICALVPIRLGDGAGDRVRRQSRIVFFGETCMYALLSPAHFHCVLHDIGLLLLNWGFRR